MKIVVAGAGETGITVSRVFSEAGHDVVLVDCDPAVLATASETLDVAILAGDIKHRSVLRKAGVATAQAFVAVTGADADNLVGAALAKELGVKAAMARVDDPGFYDSSEGAEYGVLGIDAVLCATRLAASALLGLIAKVSMSFVQSFASHGLRAGVLPVGDETSWVGHSPATVRLLPGVRLCAVLRDGFVRAPSDFERLEPGDGLLIAGDADAFLDAWARLAPAGRKQRALIVGGGEVGSQLASALRRRIDRVELVELDPDRALKLSDELGGVTVMTGDARNAAFLKDLQVDTVDYLAAVTTNDETNLLVSLLGRRLGIRDVFTLLRQPGHEELFTELGVEGAGEFDILARSVKDAAAVEGLVREERLPATGYMFVEWRLPPLGHDGLVTMSDLPVGSEALLLGLVRGADSIEVTPRLRFMGRETLLFLVSRRARSRLVRQLEQLDKEVVG